MMRAAETPYMETEVLIAVLNDDAAYAASILGKMDDTELRELDMVLARAGKLVNLTRNARKHGII